MYTGIVTLFPLISPSVKSRTAKPEDPGSIPSHLPRKHPLPYQCQVLSSRFPNCLQYDVTAQHLGWASAQDNSRFILLLVVSSYMTHGRTFMPFNMHACVYVCACMRVCMCMCVFLRDREGS